MSFKLVDGLTDTLLNRLSYKQVRHIVLLETIVQLARLSVEKLYVQQDQDGFCGIEDAISVIINDVMDIDHGWVWHDLNTHEHLVNQRLFDVVDDSNEQDQMIIYQSAIATSKYHLEKLFETRKGK
jgi:hypothetical protein